MAPTARRAILDMWVWDYDGFVSSLRPDAVDLGSERPAGQDPNDHDGGEHGDGVGVG